MVSFLERLKLDTVSSDLKDKGYAYVQEFLSLKEGDALKKEIPNFNAEHYTLPNLEKNAVYPSMKSDSRESYASMVIEAGEQSDLPHVTTSSAPIIELLRFHDSLLSHLIGFPVPPSHRKMLNWQMYSQNFVGLSKFLRRHRDGNYSAYELGSERTFIVKEALYARYVFGINIENKNEGTFRGTSLYDTFENKTVHLPHEPGSLIVFDNIRMEHFVEPLGRPRIFIGIRCFDVDPFYFKASSSDSVSLALPSLDSPGRGIFITSAEAKLLLQNFYEKKWPEELLKIKKEGAVF